MAFHFDRTVISDGTRVTVTRCAADDIDVQINICPKGDRSYPRFTLFLTLKGAAELADALKDVTAEVADADAS